MEAVNSPYRHNIPCPEWLNGDALQLSNRAEPLAEIPRRRVTSAGLLYGASHRAEPRIQQHPQRALTRIEREKFDHRDAAIDVRNYTRQAADAPQTRRPGRIVRAAYPLPRHHLPAPLYVALFLLCVVIEVARVSPLTSGKRSTHAKLRNSTFAPTTCIRPIHSSIGTPGIRAA